MDDGDPGVADHAHTGSDFELAAGWLPHESIGSLGTVAYCTDQDLRPEQEYCVVTATLDAPPTRRCSAEGRRPRRPSW